MRRLSTAVLGAAMCFGLLGNVSSANAQGAALRALEEAGVAAKSATALEDAARAAGILGADTAKPSVEMSSTLRNSNLFEHMQSEAGPSSFCGGAGLAGGYASDSTTTGLGTYGLCRGGVHLYQDHGLMLGQH